MDARGTKYFKQKSKWTTAERTMILQCMCSTLHPMYSCWKFYHNFCSLLRNSPFEFFIFLFLSLHTFSKWAWHVDLRFFDLRVSVRCMYSAITCQVKCACFPQLLSSKMLNMLWKKDNTDGRWMLIWTTNPKVFQ